MLSRKKTKYDTIFYKVGPGDSLSRIIKKYYGALARQEQQLIISSIQADNPEIKNPNLIHPGQTITIDIPQNYGPVPGLPKQPVIKANNKTVKALKQTLKHTTPQEKDLISGMAPVLLGVGTTNLMMINHTFKTNAPLVAEMAENYNEYKAEKMTKGQYDYRRNKILNKLKVKLGPTNYLLNGNKSPNEILRITRTKDSVPTHAMTHQINRMGSLSKLASRGGVVLSVAGLGVACYGIANADDKQKKNEILFEALGGFTGGLAYGGAATIAVALMATPVGWVGALVIGIGGAVSGFAAGYGAKYWYSTRGNSIDFANITKVDQLCM